MNPKPRTERSWQAMKNNAQGGFFEGYIKAACEFYKSRGVAVVEKMPEPFKVTSTSRDGTFTVYCQRPAGLHGNPAWRAGNLL